ncbi:MAG: acyltransferase domain-containing protein, partial [Niveispirillum sp.]|nr:acyltransferase domain-containing protein [Niveispirillum sp.]
YDTHPGFRATLDRCADILAPLLDQSLLDILYPADGVLSTIDQTAHTQPALFALEYALATLWLSWGIVPAAVIGHSLGEYVAACIAGVFSLEDGLTLVAARARLMQALPQDGLMVAVAASTAEIEPLLRSLAADVAIAAENGPRSTVISGRTTSVETLMSQLLDKGITSQRLKTSHAFHSPLMDPILAEFRQVAAKVTYSAPRIDLISNLTGERVGEEIATPDYWVRHLRQPVSFMTGMRTITALGCDRFVEIGPKPTLLGLAAACVSSDTALWLPSLSDRKADWSQLLHSLSQLAVRGPVDWVGFDSAYQRARLALPTYPFQRRRYWLDRPTGSTLPATRPASPGNSGSPLIGSRLRLPSLKTVVFENRLDPDRLPLLRDHLIFGEMVVSGACLVSMLLEAARSNLDKGSLELRDIYFVQPLIVPSGHPRQVQITLTPAGQTTTVQVISFTDGQDDADMRTHVEAVLASAGRAEPTAAVSRDAIWARCSQDLPCQAFFDAQDSRQIRLGPSYRWAEQMRLGNRESVCRMRVPGALGGLPSQPFHPGMLDASFGLLLATAPLAADDTWLPFSIEA